MRIFPNIDAADAAAHNDIVSFPASLQRKLDEANALLQGGNPAEAVSALQSVGAELARSSPELCVLALGTQLGARAISTDETEMDTTTVTTEKYAFGIRYGRSVTTTSTANTGKRSTQLL